MQFQETSNRSAGFLLLALAIINLVAKAIYPLTRDNLPAEIAFTLGYNVGFFALFFILIGKLKNLSLKIVLVVIAGGIFLYDLINQMQWWETQPGG